ncbi:hypothetical protein JIQ42_05069 [Leishmania sp. Namibia]|uniref:hypothetical protein n=1 Tax=Leishmania sp. Namibia TaxID=2802991 RepID=UPI001B5895A2|nr:hypothetical protein JIQ42_05069 [Leishmania sp. Namibia]
MWQHRNQPPANTNPCQYRLAARLSAVAVSPMMEHGEDYEVATVHDHRMKTTDFITSFYTAKACSTALRAYERAQVRAALACQFGCALVHPQQSRSVVLVRLRLTSSPFFTLVHRSYAVGVRAVRKTSLMSTSPPQLQPRALLRCPVSRSARSVSRGAAPQRCLRAV